MAAAYAALVSLMNTVDAIPNNPRVFTSLDEYQTESLREKLDSLLQFVEDYDFRGGKTKDAVEDLKSQIGSAAHAAEVLIEAHIVDRIITHPSLYLQKMILLMRFFIDEFEDCGYFVSRIKQVIEDLKTEIKSVAHAVDDMISHEAKESVQGSEIQGITKEAVEDLITRITYASSTANFALICVEDSDFHRPHISEQSQTIIEDMGSLIDKKVIEFMRSLIEDFEHYDSHGGIAKEALEDLKSNIESLAHAADVLISDGAKGSVQKDPTQGITKEAVEDLKTRIAHAARAAEVMLNSVEDFEFCRRRICEQSQKITEDMNFLKKKLEYVKEQSKHEEQSLDLQKTTEDMGSLFEKKAKEVLSLIEDFVDYDSQGGIALEAAFEHVQSQIESLGHAAKVMLSDGAKEIVQKELTQDDYDFHASITEDAVEYLKTRIASTARAAEDLLNSVEDFDFRRRHVSEKLQKIIEDMDSLARKLDYVKEQRKHEEQSLDLQKIIEDMGFLIDKVNNVQEQMEHEYQKPTDSMPTAAPSRFYSASGKTSIVGFDGYMHQLKDRLTGDRSEWQVIPITGMGGIGKTTLARNIFDDLLIVQHFDKRAWVTVSQAYSVRKILVEILSSVGGSTGGLGEKSENKLGTELHKILFDRRYLIILDDMWSIDAWEKLHSFFPKQKNGSRIVVTTRQLDMVKYFDTSALILSFLDDDKSWQLFSENVFAYEDCPPELEGIGRKIVKKCGGLPLSIAVIGGLLGKSSRVQEYWENVEKNMSSIVNSAEENLCSDILSLSYNHLPTPLKPCFLYLGIFPENTEIPVTRLVRLWVAEGFLKPNKDHSLEEVGEGYVKDLEGRNLIVVQRPFRNYAVKTFCKVHDLLRELCIRTAKKEKFFCVRSGLDTSRHKDRQGLSVFHKIILWNQGYPPKVLSLSVRGETQHENCELWRVVFNHAFTKSTWEQVSLRYSEQIYPFSNRPALPTLPPWWNLQTYMNMHDGSPNEASLFEIWEMTQLRHVEATRIHLPDPPLGDNHDRIVLENLQTLGTVANFKCSEEVCKRMPNIKKLSIQYSPEDEVIGWSTLLNCISNVGRFNKLESLKYSFDDDPNRDELLQNLKFPKSLKRLRLKGCGLHWDDLTIIGSLPHLEVLKLNYNSVQGSEWNPIENQFRSLKSLKVQSDKLINWNADNSHFPILEKLILKTQKLNEIPEDIGEIPTLRVIHLSYCGASVAISALKILKVQEDYGNNDIKVFVDDKEAILKKVREHVELECISIDNIQFC